MLTFDLMRWLTFNLLNSGFPQKIPLRIPFPRIQNPFSGNAISDENIKKKNGTVENIRGILNIPINNLSMEDHTLIGRFLDNRDNFIVRDEFNEVLYECVRDFITIIYIKQNLSIGMMNQNHPKQLNLSELTLA